MKPTKDVVLVAIQAVLLLAYLFRPPLTDLHLAAWVRMAGLVIATLGALTITSAIVTLNRNLTPFPSPKGNGSLITSGIYHYMRHPIYSGILLGAFGYGMYSVSIYRMGIGALLLLLFIYKARYEEGLLMGKFPDYAAYRKRTKMFLPWVV